MQNRSFTREGVSGGASRVRRRALLGLVVLVALVVLAGALAFFTRGTRPAANPVSPVASSPSSASASPSASPTGGAGSVPAPPSTHNPIAYAKAAAVALWSYDTRSYSQPELVAGLHRWLTAEGNYADASSVDRLVPSPLLWGRMADSGQLATATADEAHFPDTFTRALQADPGAIKQAYIYAVTVTGKQSISWNGAPQGGAEDRSSTLAVQCRPDRPCSLVGVLPTVSP
ncbi:hypothetical protein [Kitasatospora sp. MBT63]|uniref:hypothetical protein n=1 Tax=Kitasatospora sp. MBT63 TaxID=1444768 RepID=UPI0006892C95|nr:hypothetical protein [Kitasatospora sp. MBT63]